MTLLVQWRSQSDIDRLVWFTGANGVTTNWKHLLARPISMATNQRRLIDEVLTELNVVLIEPLKRFADRLADLLGHLRPLCVEHMARVLALQLRMLRDERKVAALRTTEGNVLQVKEVVLLPRSARLFDGVRELRTLR